MVASLDLLDKIGNLICRKYIIFPVSIKFQPDIKYLPRLGNLQDIFMQKLQGVLKYHMQLAKEGFFDLILCHCFLIFSFLFICVLMNCVPKIMPIFKENFQEYSREYF